MANVANLMAEILAIADKKLVVGARVEARVNAHEETVIGLILPPRYTGNADLSRKPARRAPR